ncbi:MAG: hypothetical protein RJA36_1563 [Pseudomonadota bacterium]|jgi:transcriptional regulator NrdR family protein
MKCPNCNAPHMEVTHVYAAGERAEARNLVCPKCRFKSSSVTFLVDRPQKRKKGFAAIALANKILEGKIVEPEIP